MDINLTIILIIMCIVVLLLLVPLFGTKLPDVSPLDTRDSLLVQNYHKKPNYKKRLVLVIEETPSCDVPLLISLIRNILMQEIKADSIILISPDESLKNIHLIRDTCIFNQIGGLTFLFKESGNHTTLLFIYPDGFNSFNNSKFLRQILETNHEIDGLKRVDTTAITPIDQVYHI